MFCFDLREAAPRHEAVCSLRIRAESSTRLPHDQSWLKYYLLKKRIGLRDPAEKQFRRGLTQLTGSRVDSRQRRFCTARETPLNPITPNPEPAFLPASRRA
jgi:hypothetical protein